MTKTLLPTIQDVFDQFDPLEPLAAGDERYVDCFRERGMAGTFARLKLSLGGVGPKALLFSGQLGDGKTTILRQLQGELEKQGQLVAFGEATNQMELGDLEYDDLILALVAVVDIALRERFQADLEGPRFRQLWEELVRIAQLEVKLEGAAEVKLGPLAKLTATVKDAPDLRLQVRQRLRQARNPTFLDICNDYLRQAQELAREHGYRSVVVLLDALDRMPETDVSGRENPDLRLFKGQATYLKDIDCRVIYTIRLETVHQADFQVEYGHPPFIVPMIPIRHQRGTTHEEGLSRLRQIIEKRLQRIGTCVEAAFDEVSSVDGLCRSSGGHLRDLMALMQSVCSEALAAHPDLPFRADDVALAIRNFGADRRWQARGHQEALTRVAESHSLEGIEREECRYLLHNRLVYEYFDGNYWYDVCPLIQDLRDDVDP